MSAQPAPRTWAADKIVRRPITALKPDPRNARLHSPEQLAQIRASMRTWGWTQPILIEKNNKIVAGHGRHEAARLEVEAGNIEFVTAPCVIKPDWWTPEQTRAYVIADNAITLNSSWDDTLLREEITALRGEDFDVSLLGFSGDQIDVLFNGWNPDEEKTSLEARMEHMDAVIKVRVPAPQQEEVAALIRKALAGVEGVTVE